MGVVLRISANDGESGYREFKMALANGKKIYVFVDDVEVRDCITADDDLGFVERYVRDAGGKLQIDPVRQDRILTEVVKGHVRIEFKDDPANAAN